MENKTESAIESVEQLTTIAQNLKNLKQDTDILRETNIKHNLKSQTINPEFNIQANMAKKERQKKQIQGMRKAFNVYLQTMEGRLTFADKVIIKIINGYLNYTVEDMELTREIAIEMLKQVHIIKNSDFYNAAEKITRIFSEYTKKCLAEFEKFIATEEIKKLIPFLQMEIDEENRKNPNTDPIILDEVLFLTNDDGTPITRRNGKPINNPFTNLLERARAHKAEGFPRVTTKPTDILKYPLDKANSRIWDLINIIDREGQIQLSINTSKKGSNQNAEVLYGINFDELESDLKITKQLTPFDKRCYIAVAALYNAGNDIVSATQIYKMMGNRGQPKAVDIEKINNSLTKMGAARVLIDNTKEVQINKKYDLFRYDASLLPFERINAYINNTLTESAIHLFREPPLVSFAKSRKQITSLPRQLLESPVSKTEANLRIDDYLIARIAHMKKNKSKIPRKILYATIFDRCDITTANQRSRAPEKIHRYLAHYRECEFIKNFRQDKDGIIILF